MLAYMKDMFKRAITKMIDCTADHFPKLWRFMEREARHILCRQTPPSLPQMGTVADPIVGFLRESPQELAQHLAQYDVISFDVFDTLVLRAFDEPKMIFRLWGFMHDQQYAYDVRRAIERELRAKTDGEVTLMDIYREMERHFGIPANQGMQDEIALELRFCRTNPYMLEVYGRLKRLGKRIVITSDMYLPKDAIEAILNQCGYADWDALYVSSDCQRTKSSGTMWTYMNSIYASNQRRIHVGDNPNSDAARAAEAGWEVCLYTNLHTTNMMPWKVKMSNLIGSLWRGLVNVQLYTGLKCTDPFYDLGFVYFGLPVYGYCQYVHEIAEKEKIGLILFAARDMRAVWEAFQELYDTPCEYLPVSRAAIFRADFEESLENVIKFIEGIAHNTDPCTIEEFFENGENDVLYAPFLLPWLERYGIARTDKLDQDTFQVIRRVLMENRATLNHSLVSDQNEAIRYFRNLWDKHGRPDRLLFADFNGRGTCLSGLRHIFTKGQIQAEIIGSMLYSATASSRDCDYLSRDLYVYSYSSLKNADFYRVHLASHLNIASSLEASIFTEEKGTLLSYSNEHGGFLYSTPPRQTAPYISAIRAGTLEFSRQFARYSKLPNGRELHIPGRDVFWPLLRGAEEFDALRRQYDTNRSDQMK